MNAEKTLTPEESLEIARSMIGRSRKTFLKQSFYFLLWGWLLILAGVGDFALIQIGFAAHWIVWPIVGTLGGIIAGIHGAKEGKKAPAATATDMGIGSVWMAFGISLIVIIPALVINDINPNGIIIIMTGLPTFASGMMLQFRSLIIGGILFWLIGFASFFIPVEYTSLAFSLAIFLGYIVPGFLLKKAEDNDSL